MASGPSPVLSYQRSSTGISAVERDLRQQPVPRVKVREARIPSVSEGLFRNHLAGMGFLRNLDTFLP